MMNPNAQILSIYQNRKDEILLSCGFQPQELGFTEVALMASVIKVVELGRLADVSADEFVNQLKAQAEKPFALCLHDVTGWLRQAFSFADTHPVSNCYA